MNKDLKKLIFKSIGLAMGVATLVLNIIKTLESKSAITLLSIGLICLAISELENRKES
ncbi:hypothetical protein KQI86_08730 [Clostridium sp. MSJ-11]|uniref:Uncharacterized protein n=1 Tax=Clostridium mobile TaxID=2841512 RepID=A0ABS6EGS4_9CLOT|nr:hypothetical protein [Clostridium mobile]MBU5484411.1 hypothetical protein [Clostridium mobile]